jgi:hypothetical protein
LCMTCLPVFINVVRTFECFIRTSFSTTDEVNVMHGIGSTVRALTL